MRAVGNQPGHPLESQREKLGQFPLSFSPSPPQLLRSFGKVASKLFSPDMGESAGSSSHKESGDTGKKRDRGECVRLRYSPQAPNHAALLAAGFRLLSEAVSLRCQIQVEDLCYTCGKVGSQPGYITSCGGLNSILICNCGLWGKHDWQW